MSATLGLPILVAALSADPCPPGEPAFYLHANGAMDGVLDFKIFEGQSTEFEVNVRMRTAFATKRGASGWSIGVAHDPSVITLVGLTTAGTDSETYFGGFAKTSVVSNETGNGFVSGWLGVFIEARHFPPVGDFSMVRARYRFLDPRDFSEDPFSMPMVKTHLQFRDGLMGSGQPVVNLIRPPTGGSLEPCLEDLEARFRLLETLDFIRGDANFDQEIDISDPTTILRALFHGDAPIHCDDAADANDDGGIDISDAIAVFGYLFLGDPPPPAPFLGAGSDPTADRLFCRP